MKKLKNFTPPKPVVEPFGPGSGQAHTFSLERDGVEAILETKEGNICILQKRADGRRAGFLHLSGGGYGRLDDSELEKLLPAEKPAGGKSDQ